MLGVGWLEMLLIGVVALIVIGPKDLPVLMHRMGKFAGTIRRMGADFQRELNKTTGLDEVRNLRSSIVAPLKATTDAIRKEFNTITPTGQVQPSGVLKPADPKAESVVNELHAAAGMKPLQTPAEAMKEAIGKATAATPAAAAAAKAPVKAAQVSKPKSTPVAAPAVSKPAPKKLVAKKAIESPAPIEAVAPAKKAAPARKLAAKPMPKSAARPVAAAKPATKPAAKSVAAAKPAIKAAAKPASKPVAAEKAPPKRKPAAKKA